MNSEFNFILCKRQGKRKIDINFGIDNLFVCKLLFTKHKEFKLILIYLLI